MAWLHATPEGAKKSRAESCKEQDEDSTFLKMPDLDGAEYVIGMLIEAGLSSSNGMGMVPLSWQEIDAWLKVTETKVSLWERLMIKELSDSYVGEFNRASAKDRPPPYMPEIESQEEIQERRNKVANKFLAFVRSFNSSTPSGETNG